MEVPIIPVIAQLKKKKQLECDFFYSCHNTSLNIIDQEVNLGLYYEGGGIHPFQLPKYFVQVENCQPVPQVATPWPANVACPCSGFVIGNRSRNDGWGWKALSITMYRWTLVWTLPPCPKAKIPCSSTLYALFLDLVLVGTGDEFTSPCCYILWSCSTVINPCGSYWNAEWQGMPSRFSITLQSELRR